MKNMRSLVALAFGAFVCGAAEFVMMGILPQTAADMGVSIPTAGNYITAYAIGVCVGTLMLVFGRTTPPKKLILIFMVIVFVGNALSAVALNSTMLIVARFIAGLPHGAFFGASAVIGKNLAEKGKATQAVAVITTGQTVSNMLGVPAGTLLAEYVSWRVSFAILAAWAVLTIVLVAAWVPFVAPIKDAGLAGQFKFLKAPGPWLILGAVLLGNGGVFCWWSYVSPWLTGVGGWSSAAVPFLMALAGFGMVMGGMAGGKVADRWRHAGAAGVGQAIGIIGLLGVFLFEGVQGSGEGVFVAQAGTALLTLWIAFGLFFINPPQQLLMAEAGQGGGELIGGATVQVAFNLGNAIGSAVGGAALNATAMDYHYPALSGVLFTALAAILLAAFSLRYEGKRQWP